MMIRNSKGLTFVELMVVISIVGILAGLAIPLISGSRTRLKTAARDIVSDLQVARLNAMKDGRWARGRIAFDGTANTYTISHLRIVNGVPSLGADGKIDTDDDVYDTDKTVKLRDLGKNIKFGTSYGNIPNSTADSTDGLTFPGNRVTFRSDGSAIQGGTVYIMDEKTKDTIAVSVVFTTGRVHTRSNYGKGWSK